MRKCQLQEAAPYWNYLQEERRTQSTEITRQMTGCPRPCLKNPLDSTWLVLPEENQWYPHPRPQAGARLSLLYKPPFTLQKSFQRHVSSRHRHFCLYHNTSMLYLDLKEPDNLYEYGLILYFCLLVPRGFFTACSCTEIVNFLLLLSWVCSC